MAISESGQSEISRYFYNNGSGKGRKDTAKYIEYQMTKGQLRQADANVAAAQLIALLNAELLDPFEMNVIDMPKEDEIKKVADTAINSFLMIYQK